MTRLFAGTPFDRPPRCERCGQLEQQCSCPPPPPVRKPPAKQTARIQLQRRKKGKLVTVVRGLAAEDNDLNELLTQLKTACGAGGTLKEDALEIQGDHVARVRDQLLAIGYRCQT